MYKRQLYGHWPENYDEVVLFVDKNNEISDLVMYAMGLKTESEMEDAMNAAMNQEQVDTTQESWTYEDLCSRTFQLILPYETYRLSLIHISPMMRMPLSLAYLRSRCHCLWKQYCRKQWNWMSVSSCPRQCSIAAG